ncbi:protein of unknown function [Xenorhabdus bovienii]|uniref:Uncharacterized protein n=1 Tax=Xenorhabdus bovienii TaxID=40576 RepID=A0A0B6X734_XENBV|nr:protein of unknown function [Xenorhabdus bovienii]
MTFPISKSSNIGHVRVNCQLWTNYLPGDFPACFAVGIFCLFFRFRQTDNLKKWCFQQLIAFDTSHGYDSQTIYEGLVDTLGVGT